MAPVRLTTHSLALLPHVLEIMTLHDCVTVESIYGTAHVCHELLAWSQTTLCSHLHTLHLEKS